MELTSPTTSESAGEVSITTHRATYPDVVAELTASCVRRATGEQLLLVPGAVGVLSGAAPVVWVHGPADMTAVSAALANSADVGEVYVCVTQAAGTIALQSAGWQRDEVVAQMVHTGSPTSEAVAGLPSVHELQPGDLADVRDLQRRSSDIEESVLEHSYGDDFFTVAAPVWMFGARDDAGRLVGTIAIRRQDRSAMAFGLSVDANWQGTGLSTALVATAVRQASAVGAEFVHAQGNEHGALRLANCGFSIVGAWQRLVRD
jgi:predicted N-acetyltransferase YhbS